MNQKYLFAVLGLVFISLVLTAGCSTYAAPELVVTAALTKISDDKETGSITYDATISIENIGQNNAYNVQVMTILSTPKDLPEYRFINKNSEFGDVEKGTTKTITERMILPATMTNYNIIISGAREPEIETTLTSVTASVMG